MTTTHGTENFKYEIHKILSTTIAPIITTIMHILWKNICFHVIQDINVFICHYIAMHMWIIASSDQKKISYSSVTLEFMLMSASRWYVSNERLRQDTDLHITSCVSLTASSIYDCKYLWN